MDTTKEEIMIVLGRNLVKYRTESGFTQEKMAEMIGISCSHYANLERGTKGISITGFWNLFKTLKVSPDYLLCGVDDFGEAEIALGNIRELLMDQPADVIEAMECMIRAYISNQGC